MGWARHLTYRHFRREVAYWCEEADPDGADDDAGGLHDSRRLFVSQTWGDMWRLDGWLDPVGGEIFAGSEHAEPWLPA